MAALFDRILIANRGEIACRIIRTARLMGIRTVAVYSDADAGAMHTRLADETCAIGPSPPADSYLNIDRIIDAAVSCGAEAVHPGYGFLAENPDFADAVRGAGLVFVGPTADSIRNMGFKDRAKRIMQDAGVPVVPGYFGPRQDATFLRIAADEIGYPVLIKPVSGGGGKGMRVVQEAGCLGRELELARSEASSAFGSGEVLLEKLIKQPRHIEVQIFGDQAGNILHLHERDCSLQRRHQKIVEECPAPVIGPDFREALCRTAVKAGEAIGYVGAGTVEFIVDGSNGMAPAAFWFLEMNTRLQVEHPITEEVTGIDLVEWQLRIAAGERLPCAQQDIQLNGHAMEARLYAEDTAGGFLPSAGILTRLECPGGIRLDAGVAAGDSVSPYYDPMIAKLIVRGKTRDEARQGLLAALSQVRLSGTSCNIPLLLAVLADDRFAAGGVDTGWLEGEFLAGQGEQEPPDAAIILAAIEMSGLGRGVSAEHGLRIWDQACWDVLLGWRSRSWSVTVAIVDRNGVAGWLGEHEFSCRHTPRGWRIESIERTPFVCGFDGKAYVALDGFWEFTALQSLASGGPDAGTGNEIVAPMPGLVRQLVVAEGQTVQRGDRVATIEAMKMEHILTAPRDGKVQEIRVSAGEQVGAGALIASLAAVE